MQTKRQDCVAAPGMESRIELDEEQAVTMEIRHLAQGIAHLPAIALAYLSSQHTMAAIAQHFDVHYTTVSRLVKAYEAAQR